MTKTTLKICREVHRDLQIYRIKNNCKTISDAISKLLEEDKDG